MHRIHCALLASVAVIALNSNASAAAPMAAPVPLWTGFYVGLNAGYAWGTSDPQLIGPLSAFAIESPGLNPHGFIGGGQAGYNWQSGQWIFGGEIDFSGLAAKADASASPFFAAKGASRSISWSSRYDWLFTARLRGGFLVAPNWLLYATGGLAVTHVNDSVVCTAPFTACSGFPGPNTVTWSDSSTLTGGAVGGGLETMFAPNWFARVEYLYTKFKDTTPPVTSAPPFPFNNVSPLYSFNHDLNVVRFAINYKFGP